jgi:hypothetical protein
MGRYLFSPAMNPTPFVRWRLAALRLRADSFGFRL